MDALFTVNGLLLHTFDKVFSSDRRILVKQFRPLRRAAVPRRKGKGKNTGEYGGVDETGCEAKGGERIVQLASGLAPVCALIERGGWDDDDDDDDMKMECNDRDTHMRSITA